MSRGAGGKGNGVSKYPEAEGTRRKRETSGPRKAWKAGEGCTVKLKKLVSAGCVKDSFSWARQQPLKDF